MPKMKTHKGMSKRITVKYKGGKTHYLKRVAKQDHFNARETGKETRGKRKDNPVAKQDTKSIRLMIGK